MSSFELFFLDSGFSYTLSKLLPYIILPLLGLIVWLIAKRWIRNGALKFVTFLIALAAPFFIYFILHPIYEGDFSNNSVPAAENAELSEIKENKLVVLTIPDCPFCKASIETMKAFKARNPKVEIEYRVCASDSAAERAVTEYAKLAEGEFKVIRSKNSLELASLAQLDFPAYVLVKKNGKNVIWSANNFGAGALDEIVARFE